MNTLARKTSFDSIINAYASSDVDPYIPRQPWFAFEFVLNIILKGILLQNLKVRCWRCGRFIDLKPWKYSFSIVSTSPKILIECKTLMFNSIIGNTCSRFKLPTLCTCEGKMRNHQPFTTRTRDVIISEDINTCWSCWVIKYYRVRPCFRRRWFHHSCCCRGRSPCCQRKYH